MPKPDVAELRKVAAEMNEDIAALRGRVVEAMRDRKPGDPVPFEITNAFARLLDASSAMHDALDDLAALEGR